MADYAWSIQTLLPLEDIGLTKLPKLAKKTWAEMISESDDDSETDLQKQIQKTKQTKTVCNQKQSQPLTQHHNPPTITSQKTNSLIFYKWSHNTGIRILLKQPPKYSPQDYYRPSTLNKTRKFYEFILIDTNSVSIKHFKDPKDPNLNTHSTIQILKVMQPRHYGSRDPSPGK